MALKKQYFKEVDLSDPFFDSLKKDYKEFSEWFAKKADNQAYVFRGDTGSVDGFLYLKLEDGPVGDISPQLPAAKRLKVGTMKINPHGTRLGERFIKKIIDHAINEQVDQVYVTVFEKHAALITLFEKYGFIKKAEKTTCNGTELVLLKTMDCISDSALKRYPKVKIGNKAIYLLSLYPNWHTRLLPDSILKSEEASIVLDVSHTNSIHKVYLAGMRGMEAIQEGDILLIYRTNDGAGHAHYRSVITSVCVVEEYRQISSFSTKDDFMHYCRPYSVFTDLELENFWITRKYPHVLRFTYNYALPRRLTRGDLIESFGFDAKAYWGLMRLDKNQLKQVLAAAELNEGLIVD